MTERMSLLSQDALHVLRLLTARGYVVVLEVRNATHTVSVHGVPRGERYFDGGTLDAAIGQINLDEFPGRAA